MADAIGSGTIAKPEKITEFQGLPIAGKTYEVLCAEVSTWWSEASIPMLWIPHNPCGLSHFHVDLRFVNDSELEAIANLQRLFSAEKNPENQSWAKLDEAGMPCQVTVNSDALTRYRWEPRRCWRSHHPAMPTSVEAIATVVDGVVEAIKCNPPELQEELQVAGRCDRCPHQGTPLNGVVAAPDGSVVCPAHGMRIRYEYSQ